MKTTVFIFVVAILSGNAMLCAALVQSHFCFRALSIYAAPLHPDDGVLPARKNIGEKNLEDYIVLATTVSLGFVIAEIAVLLTVFLSGRFSPGAILSCVALPIPLYIVSVTSCVAALSHLKKSTGEKCRRLICGLTPLFTVVVAIVLNHAR